MNKRSDTESRSERERRWQPERRRSSGPRKNPTHTGRRAQERRSSRRLEQELEGTPERAHHQMSLDEVRARMANLQHDIEHGYITTEAELTTELNGIEREVRAMFRKAGGEMASVCENVLADVKRCEAAVAQGQVEVIEALQHAMERID